MPRIKQLHTTIYTFSMCVKIQGDDKILQHKYLKMSIKVIILD